MANKTKFRPNRVEWIVPVLCTVVLICSCVSISSHKYFWFDELCTYYPASSSSFNQLISFINDKVQCGSYIYFILIWLWAKLFSASELSLRLFSCLGFGLAMMIMWSVLRRIYGFWSASLSIIVVFLGSRIILYQNSEARFYGLLLAITAWLCKVTIDNIETRTFNLSVFMMLFLLNGLLPLIHPFGFLYSLIFVTGVFIYDWKRHCIRVWYYLGLLAGWLLFIPFIPAFLLQYELSIPHFWIQKPSIANLGKVYISSPGKDFIFIITVIFLFIISFLFKLLAERVTAKEDKPKRFHDELLLFLGAFFLAFPLGVWIYSQYFYPIFQERYVIIYNLGLTILIAAVLARILPKTQRGLNVYCLFFMLFLGVFLPLKVGLSLRVGNYSDRLERKLPILIADESYKDLAVITDNAHAYLQIFHYNKNKKRYYFVLDWEEALQDRGQSATHDFQVMQALKRQLHDQNIITTEEFLAKNSKFIVNEYQGWFSYRIRNNPRYLVRKLYNQTYLVEIKY